MTKGRQWKKSLISSTFSFHFLDVDISFHLFPEPKKRKKISFLPSKKKCNSIAKKEREKKKNRFACVHRKAFHLVKNLLQST